MTIFFLYLSMFYLHLFKMHPTYQLSKNSFSLMQGDLGHVTFVILILTFYNFDTPSLTLAFI